MFVTAQACLQIGLADAWARLADLLCAGWLLSASQEAYDTGISRAQPGPPGSAWGRCQLVTVHAQDQAARHCPARLALRWEVTGPDGERFPALDADLTLTPAGERATTLALIGVYRPPPGDQSTGDDRAAVQRVAATTIRAFLGRIAKAICGPARAGEFLRPAAP
jgi:hypothetical protein